MLIMLNMKNKQDTKNYSTIDNIFVLQSIIQKYLSRQKGDIMFCLLTFRRHSILFHMLFYGTKCKDVAYMERFWYYLETCIVN